MEEDTFTFLAYCFGVLVRYVQLFIAEYYTFYVKYISLTLEIFNWIFGLSR